MNKSDPVWNIFLGYLILIFFILIAGSLSAQTPCKEDICVVEFNAAWNESNGAKYLDKLTDCGVKRVLIDKSDYQKEFGIIVVPTIIIFNGKEVKRFQADLSFKMLATREDVQEVVDEIIMSDF